MAKTLKIWNGRGHRCFKPGDPLLSGHRPNVSTHAYVAAYSRADARRLIAEYAGCDPGETELRVYFSEGAWGLHMEGVTPERGLWLSVGCQAPVRVV